MKRKRYWRVQSCCMVDGTRGKMDDCCIAVDEQEAVYCCIASEARGNVNCCVAEGQEAKNLKKVDCSVIGVGRFVHPWRIVRVSTLGD